MSEKNRVEIEKIDIDGMENLAMLFLKIGAFLCFLGWTWVHFYWEGPYGVLFWHESSFEWAEKLGLTWDEYVGTGANDGWIQKWMGRISWLFLIFTLAALSVGKNTRIQFGILFIGSGFVGIIAYTKFLHAQQQVPMLLEYGCQMLIPILLVSALVWGIRHPVSITIGMVAFISTFVGHGLYAMGLWPTPANFFGMINLVLQVDYESSKTILFLAGLLDILVCIGLFIPRVREVSALYAAAWGFMTAAARPLSGMSTDLNYWGADQFLHEAILRAPHFCIPVYLFLVFRIYSGENKLKSGSEVA